MLCRSSLGRRPRGLAEVQRNAAAAPGPSASARSRPTSGSPASTPVPGIRCSVCEETRTVLCMHIGSSSKMPSASPTPRRRPRSCCRSTTRWRRWPTSSLLGRARPVPRTEARLLGRPDRLDHVSAPGGPTTRGSTTPPGPGRKRSGAALDLLPRPDLRVLHQRRSTARVPGRGDEDNVCFETDYPHTATTWPFTRDEVVRMIAPLTEGQRYKVLRGNAIKMLDLDRV